MSAIRFLAGGVLADRLLASPAAAYGPAVRDPRVDVLRGLALLMIFINHIPANPFSAVTLASWGVADAADLFVLLAGFSAGMAYGPGIDRKGLIAGSQPVLRRVFTLYAVQALLIVSVCALILFAMHRYQNPLYAEAINIWPALNDPLRTAAFAGVLKFQPHYVDILPLYILLLGAFPAIYVLARRSPGLALVLSFALWWASRGYGLNLPTGPEHGHWFFNPFAWQFIFVIGLVASLWVRAYGLWTPSRLMVGLGAAIILAGFVMRSPWSEVWQINGIPALPEAFQIGFDKTNLGPERIVYAIGVVLVMWRWLSVRADAQSFPARLLAAMGRHSLPVFAVGTILSIGSHVAVVESVAGDVGFPVVSVIGSLVLVVLGSWLDWRSRKSRKVVRADNAPQALAA
jgi:hypothetical protein